MAELTYRLPVTQVHLAGTVVTRTDALAAPRAKPKVVREAGVDVEVVADGRTSVPFIASATSKDQAGVTFGWLADGRLTSVGTSYTSGESTALKTIATIGGTAFVGALALSLGPLTAGAAALAAGAATAMALGAGADGGVSLFGAVEGEEGDEAEQTPVEDPSAEDLGIHAAYLAEHPYEHEALYRYRLALIAATARHADTSRRLATDPDVAGAELKVLRKALRMVRAEATRAEQHYELWRASKRSTTTETHEGWWYVDQLPTAAELDIEAAGHNHDDVFWWPTCAALGVAVTCDLIVASAEPAVAGDGEGVPGAGVVRFRRPVQAVIATWSLTVDHDSRRHYAVERLEQQMLTVAHPSATAEIDVEAADAASATLDVTFDASGGPLTAARTAKGRQLDRAETIAELPAHVAAGGKAALEAVSTFAPAAVRTAVLRQQVALLEQEKLHKGLLAPTPADALAGLKAELAQAELEAKIAEARARTADPSTAAFSITVTPAVEGAEG